MSENDGQVLLSIEQDIVAANSEDIKQKLKDALSDDLKVLTVDLDKVQQVDSVGVGVLIACYNSLRKEGKEFKLINVDTKIFELFQVMRLNKHFEIEVKQE